MAYSIELTLDYITISSTESKKTIVGCYTFEVINEDTINFYTGGLTPIALASAEITTVNGSNVAGNTASALYTILNTALGI